METKVSSKQKRYKIRLDQLTEQQIINIMDWLHEHHDSNHVSLHSNKRKGPNNDIIYVYYRADVSFSDKQAAQFREHYNALAISEIHEKVAI